MYFSIWVILTTPLVACSATLVCRDHLSVLSADTIFLHLKGRMFLKIKEGDQE